MAKRIFIYLKGEYFCRFFHKPLFFNLGGYGGKNIFGIKRKSYREFNCIKCNNYWETERKPKWYKLPQEERYIITEKIKEEDKNG